jgi:hypothetical protein
MEGHERLDLQRGEEKGKKKKETEGFQILLIFIG